MSNITKQTVNVLIGGENFDLRASESPDHIKQVADYIDKKLKDLNVKADADIMKDKNFSMILALNIGDDLFKLKDESAQKIDDLVAQIKTLSDSDSVAAEDIGKADEIQKQVKDLKKQLNSKSNDYESLFTQFQSKEKEVKSLKEDNKKLQKENQSLGKEVESLKEDNEKLQKENQSLGKEVESLKEDNEKLQKENSRLEEEYKNYQKENSVLEKRNSELEGQMEQLVSFNKSLSSKLDDYESLLPQLQSKEKEVCSLKNDNEKLQKENQSLKKEVESFEEDNKKLQKENSRLRENDENHQEKISELENRIEELTNLKEQLDSQLSMYKLMDRYQGKKRKADSPKEEKTKHKNKKVGNQLTSETFEKIRDLSIKSDNNIANSADHISKMHGEERNINTESVTSYEPKKIIETVETNNVKSTAVSVNEVNKANENNIDLSPRDDIIKTNISCMLGSDYVDVLNEKPYYFYIADTDDENIFNVYPTRYGLDNSSYLISLFDNKQKGDKSYIIKPAKIYKRVIGYELMERGSVVTKM